MPCHSNRRFDTASTLAQNIERLIDHTIGKVTSVLRQLLYSNYATGNTQAQIHSEDEKHWRFECVVQTLGNGPTEYNEFSVSEYYVTAIRAIERTLNWNKHGHKNTIKEGKADKHMLFTAWTNLHLH